MTQLFGADYRLYNWSSCYPVPRWWVHPDQRV